MISYGTSCKIVEDPAKGSWQDAGRFFQVNLTTEDSENLKLVI